MQIYDWKLRLIHKKITRVFFHILSQPKNSSMHQIVTCSQNQFNLLPATFQLFTPHLFRCQTEQFNYLPPTPVQQHYHGHNLTNYSLLAGPFSSLVARTIPVFTPLVAETVELFTYISNILVFWLLLRYKQTM